MLNWSEELFHFLILIISILSLYSGTMAIAMSKREAKLNKELDNQKRVYQRQNSALINYNQLLEKKLKVRSAYTKEITDKAKTLMASSDGLAVKPEEVQLKIRDAFNCVLAVQREERFDGSGVKICVSSLLEVITQVWEEECNALDVPFSIEDKSNKSCVWLESFTMDDLFNTLLANIFEYKAMIQKVRFVVKVRENKVMVTVTVFSDAIEPESRALVSRSISDDVVQSLATESGGELLVDTPVSEAISISLRWPTIPDRLSENFSVFDRIAMQNNLFENRAKPVFDTDPWLQQVYDLIDHCYSDSHFGTSAAAKKLYVSERSLQRRFKGFTGGTFTEYLSDKRLESACKLLLTGAKVSEVASQTGFNDPSYFSKKFRQHYGVSPSQFSQ